MEEDIKRKLAEFRELQQKARRLSLAHWVEQGKLGKITTEKELLEYSKWRTKAGIALNEFHDLLNQRHPEQQLWSNLEAERKRLIEKLKHTEELLKRWQT
ncbi:MAG TPA: hypothetical protein VK674_01150 [Candidatus Limnocylindria bacterium]|nr:hypothetical protein [Candidatus Limnocylindria bacterium]